MVHARLGWTMIVLAAAAVPASAAQKAAERPKILSDLVGCRAIQESAARLACFDREVAALDTAEQARDVVVVDRAQVREARRSLFGFSLPSLAVFGDRKDKTEADAFTEIETTIRAASYDGRSQRWTVVLEDGARWRQMEVKSFRRDPKAGMPIRIREAPVGGYFVNIAGQQATRMRREN